MHAALKSTVMAGVSLLLILLAAGPANAWLCETMPRHQVLQLPIMFVAGGLLAGAFTTWRIYGHGWTIATLIFVVGVLIFWMLPRSIDLAVLDNKINRIMCGGLILSGSLTVMAFRGAIIEVRIVFVGMLAAMLLATGFVLSIYNLLLCGSFSITQQQNTGHALVAIGFFLILIVIRMLFSNTKQESQEGHHEKIIPSTKHSDRNKACGKVGKKEEEFW